MATTTRSKRETSPRKRAEPVAEKERYFEAVGRRKTSAARVRLFTKGTGIMVNGHEYRDYFPTQELQKIAPEIYRETVKAKERSQKIERILSRFREGKISETIARRELTSLTKQSFQTRIATLDQELEEAKKRVEYLKRVKKNPNTLVNEEVERYLGKGTREELMPSVAPVAPY